MDPAIQFGDDDSVETKVPSTTTRPRLPTPAGELPECDICYQQFGVERKPLPCHGCKKQFCKPCLMDWVKHQPSLSKRECFTEYTCPNCRRRMHDDMLATLGVRSPVYRLSTAYSRGSIRDHGQPRPRPTRPAPRARIRPTQSMHGFVPGRAENIYRSSAPYYPYNYSQTAPYYMMPPAWLGSGGFSSSYSNNEATAMQPAYTTPAPAPTVPEPSQYTNTIPASSMYRTATPQYYSHQYHATLPHPHSSASSIQPRSRDVDFIHPELHSNYVRGCPTFARRHHAQQSDGGFRQTPHFGSHYSQPVYYQPPTQGLNSQDQWNPMTLPPLVGMLPLPASYPDPITATGRPYSSIYSQTPSSEQQLRENAIPGQSNSNDLGFNFSTNNTTPPTFYFPTQASNSAFVQ